MSIKVLRRVHKPIQSTMPALFESRLEAIKSWLPSLRGSRKSASGDAASALELIKEFFTMNAPDISLANITALASKLKMPLLIAVGIAAVAAIIYLVYKVYTNRESIQAAIDEFMADLKNVAPDLVKIPGWLDSIKHEISDAFSMENPAGIVERLVKIKDAVMGHQKTISPANMGSGLLYIPGHSHHGGGLKVPLHY